ncbi:tRNA (guanine(9)-N(1))-methyltransferase [Naganishia cerealis]|uniref:tRNA (Guanine(9)-N(1))-methyltransferase n=1 Tax=Naganishia cerealis TaxID=610337 RepID=A0ACC2VWE4_9TREE|nr:tRNA (guanine(9)-N(1))-methyltransferase [Naganishia cerealis]
MAETTEPTLALHDESSRSETEAVAETKVRPELPPGMSRNQWKKLQRQKRWEETKEEYRLIKRQKKKAARERKRHSRGEEDSGTDDINYHQQKRPKIPSQQKQTGVKIVIDCEFDELMNNKEIVSLSNQITRAYSAKRHCEYDLQLDITSFNKNLKLRFDKSVSQYKLWTNIQFQENDHLADILPTDPQERSKWVYLTADTDEVITELLPDHTYIIGGIVDKNRHKLICKKKAEQLGLRVGKLPIDQFIQLNGRQVLATSHVFELCCKWFELNKDWGRAFNEVLPPRKLEKGEKEGKKEKVEEKGEEDEKEEETSGPKFQEPSEKNEELQVN